MALFRSGEDVDARLCATAERITDAEQVERVIGFALSPVQFSVMLTCPKFTRTLLAKARAVGADTYATAFRQLQSLPGRRSSTNGQPDGEWKGLLEAAENMARIHANDPELGPFYATVAEHERDWMKHERGLKYDQDKEA